MAPPIITNETARALVKQMAESSRLVEEIKWRELAALDDAGALRTSDALIEAALRVPIPERGAAHRASSSSKRCFIVSAGVESALRRRAGH